VDNILLPSFKGRVGNEVVSEEEIPPGSFLSRALGLTADSAEALALALKIVLSSPGIAGISLTHFPLLSGLLQERREEIGEEAKSLPVMSERRSRDLEIFLRGVAEVKRAEEELSREEIEKTFREEEMREEENEEYLFTSPEAREMLIGANYVYTEGKSYFRAGVVSKKMQDKRNPRKIYIEEDKYIPKRKWVQIRKNDHVDHKFFSELNWKKIEKCMTFYTDVCYYVLIKPNYISSDRFYRLSLERSDFFLASGRGEKNTLSLERSDFFLASGRGEKNTLSLERGDGIEKDLSGLLSGSYKEFLPSFNSRALFYHSLDRAGGFFKYYLAGRQGGTFFPLPLPAQDICEGHNFFLFFGRSPVGCYLYLFEKNGTFLRGFKFSQRMLVLVGPDMFDGIILASFGEEELSFVRISPDLESVTKWSTDYLHQISPERFEGEEDENRLVEMKLINRPDWDLDSNPEPYLDRFAERGSTTPEVEVKELTPERVFTQRYKLKN